MDDEPMWAADRVVALTPGSAFTIPKTANEFAIKVPLRNMSWIMTVEHILDSFLRFIIMKQDKAQQAARDEKLAPSDDRVKIGKSNLRMDPSVTQKEETYQVIDVELFREILGICPRVQNQEFTELPTSDSLLEFLLDLGYKENVVYAALIWEDLQYQIDNMQSKNSEAYKTFIGISTGLIPLKKGRGKGAQGTKAIVVLKKTNATSKKKQSKRKLALHDESDESEGEPENRPIGRKKRSPRAVVIQEPPSIPRAIKASKRESRFQHQTGGLSEGASLRPEVPDELIRKSAVSDKGTGSTDDEEYLLAHKDEKPEDIPWKSSNDDESEDDDEEDESDDDKSIDIEKSDDERMDTDVEDQDDEELKADEEQKGDDQAVDVPPSKPPVPPLPATEIQFTQVSNSEAVKSIVQRFTELERAVKELKQAEHSTTILALIRSQELSEKRNYKDIIEDSVQANVINEVKDFLPKFLPQALKEALEKTLLSLGQSSSQGQSAIEASESLSKSTTKACDNPDKVLKKRDRGDYQDEDPSAGSNQGKKTKKRIFNESESSKNTSTTKESSIGKSLAKTSKSRKSVTPKESVEEPVFETASDDVEQTIDDKVGDVGQPPHTDVDETQANAASRILKKDWFKEAPRPKTLDPD
ncbi:hypothetical protein Tco_1553770 [Tanacetum coccineum]